MRSLYILVFLVALFSLAQLSFGLAFKDDEGATTTMNGVAVKSVIATSDDEKKEYNKEEKKAEKKEEKKEDKNEKKEKKEEKKDVKKEEKKEVEEKKKKEVKEEVKKEEKKEDKEEKKEEKKDVKKDTKASAGEAKGLGPAPDTDMPSDAIAGKASYYDEYGSPAVACADKVVCDKEGWCAAISININTANKLKCGECVKVRYKDKAAIIKITDTCMGCTDDKLDLSTPLFTYLAGSTAPGILGDKGDKFEWAYVKCP